MNLKLEKKGFRSIIMVTLLTLLVLTTCTCNGPRLMLGPQSSGNLTDYSTFFGKPVRPTVDVTVYATSRIDGLGLASWHHQRLLARQRYQAMLDLEFYRRRVLMQKRCLPTKLYPYPRTIRSSSNRYRTGWTGRRPSLRTGSRRRN